MSLLENIPFLTGPFLLCIQADHIGACQLMIPVYEDVQVDYKDRIYFLLVEEKNNPELIQHYRINRYPTMLMFYDGELKDSIQGLINRTELYKRIDQLLSHQIQSNK